MGGSILLFVIAVLLGCILLVLVALTRKILPNNEASAIILSAQLMRQVTQANANLTDEERSKIKKAINQTIEPYSMN